MPLDIRNVKHLKILEDKMKLEGFTSEEISKVMGENWLRVLNDFFLKLNSLSVHIVFTIFTEKEQIKNTKQVYYKYIKRKERCL